MNIESGIYLINLSQEEYLAHSTIYDQVEGESGFLRKQWPKIYQDPEYEGWMNDPGEPSTRFLIMNGSLVAAHGAVSQRIIQSFHISTLGGLLVRPEERGKGYGSRLLDARTDWIQRNGSDLGVLICSVSLETFNERFGWKRLPNQGTIRYGLNETTAHLLEGNRITMGLSIPGKNEAYEFAASDKPLYLGKPF